MMDAISGHSTVDQRVAMTLMPVLTERAILMQNLSNAVKLADSDGDGAGEMLEGVLRKQFDIESQVFDRLDAVVKAFAADRVFIVQEGALVHALAERMATTWNTANTIDEDGKVPATKDGYIRDVQLFLANLKTEGVIS